jgi:uncharacterized membrane protein
MLATLKRYFLAGLLAMLPIAVTLYIAYRLFLFFDGLLGHVIQHLTGHYLPGLGILAVLAVVTLTGAAVSNFLGAYVLGWVDRLFTRMPLLKSVYEATKGLLATVFERRAGALRHVVLVPFPSEAAWTVGFLVAERVPGDPARAAVFVPFAPPTAGHLVLVEARRMVRTEMTTEQAMRLLLSGGLASPPEGLDLGLAAAAAGWAPREEEAVPAGAEAPR